MIETIKEFIEISRLRPAVKRNDFKSVLLHEKQGGRGEDAAYHARLAANANFVNRLFSAHYYVDDRQIINIIPDDEIAIHSDADKNNSTVAVCMCVYPQCDYDALISNTESIIYNILVRNGIKLVSDALTLSDALSEVGSRFMTENRFASIAKNLQKSLLSNSYSDDSSKSQEADSTATVSADYNSLPKSGEGEPKTPPVRVDEGEYPPASTEAESIDILELAPYMNLT